MDRSLGVAIALSLSSVALPARAHISLERAGTHASRYGDELIKEGPCGMAGGGRGANVYTYAPGETITVRLAEYVPHPGYFRIAFDADGDDDFVDPVSIDPVDPARGCPGAGLPEEQQARDMCTGSDFYNNDAVLPGMDNLMPHVEASPDGMYEFEVTLPDVECDNCTLQVIQVMEDTSHGPYNVEVGGLFDTGDIYYQCIDLVLTRAQGGAGGGAPEMGDDTDGGSAGMPEATPSRDDGGCGVVHGPGAPLRAHALWPLLALMLACRRRTRPHRPVPSAAG